MVSEEIVQLIAKLKQLRFEMDSAEEKFKVAKENYAKIVADASEKLRFEGLESLTLTDGTSLKVKEKMRCSLSKDRQKKQGVADWLRSRSMDSLISSTLIVPASQASALTEMKIPFEEDTEMNTNSVKAYLLNELAAGTLTTDDIPTGISYFLYDDIEWS